MDGGLGAEARYRAACGAVIGHLRAARGWSLREFAREVGTAHTTLYAIERGDAIPGIDILDRIASACGLDLPTVLRLIADQLVAGAHSTEPTLLDVLAAVQDLSPSQRRELLTFVAFLRYRDQDA